MDIQQILHRAGPQDVEITGWDGGTITVKLRRPSLVDMIVGDYVPNPLIEPVSKLFRANPGEVSELGEAQLAKALHCIAKSVLIEPTMEQLQQAGVSLTDDQYMQIYAYAIGGAQRLSTFRHIAGGAAGEYVAADAHPTE